MRYCRLPQILLLAFSLAWAVPLAGQPQAPLRVSPRGSLLYDSYCAVCHGVDGRAETPVSSHLKPQPRNFADSVEMARVTEDRIYRAIKEGRPGTAMAPWGQVLSETQIGDLIDYIRSLRKPLPPEFSIEKLSLEVGRRIYEKDCAFCHGADGRADTDVAKALRPRPRNFSDPVEMARVDDGRMYVAIKLGRPGSLMAGWGELLSPVEIIDVMRYVRSLEQPPPTGMKRGGLDVLVGERIYREHCIQCHGEKGDSQTPISQSLVPRPRDFTNAQEMARITDRQMAQVIIHGSPGTSMAPWSGILNAEDIRRVILFIRKNFQRQPS
jgi:cytochrome c oxidase cbb3-type subunit 3